jgi:hypothetical protein
LRTELCRRINRLTEAVRFERKYQSELFWKDFLAWDHTARRRSTYRGMYHLWEAYNEDAFPAGTDKDNDDDDEDEDEEGVEDEGQHGVVIKQEDEGNGDLLPEYEAVLAAGYDEEAFLEQALAASATKEDKQFPDLAEVVKLTRMVAESVVIASTCAYGGVPGAGGATTSRCSTAASTGPCVVINPLRPPPPHVHIDLVSSEEDDDE